MAISQAQEELKNIFLTTVGTTVDRDFRISDAYSKELSVFTDEVFPDFYVASVVYRLVFGLTGGAHE